MAATFTVRLTTSELQATRMAIDSVKHAEENLPRCRALLRVKWKLAEALETQGKTSKVARYRDLEMGPWRRWRGATK